MCERVRKFEQSTDEPFLIYKFAESLLVVGDHQFYRGYCQLIFKRHAREMHELNEKTQVAVFAELMLAARAVALAFAPWKMNYACYGNVVEHIHWHLFPRYAADAEREQVPWTRAAQFTDYKTADQTAREIAALIRSRIENFI